MNETYNNLENGPGGVGTSECFILCLILGGLGLTLSFVSLYYMVNIMTSTQLLDGEIVKVDSTWISQNILGLLAQILFSSIAIYAGVTGEAIVRNKRLICIGMLAVLAKVLLDFSIIVLTADTVTDQDNIMPVSLYIGLSIFVVIREALPAAAAVSFMNKKRTATRVFAVFTMVSYFAYIVPYITMFVTERETFDLIRIFYIAAAGIAVFCIDNGGVFFGTWSLYLCAGRYLPRRRTLDNDVDLQLRRYNEDADKERYVYGEDMDADKEQYMYGEDMDADKEQHMYGEDMDADKEQYMYGEDMDA
ncbi:MAG: hypothetical protein EOM18_15785, partial [Clostridia bacterium]|nr:hypothetical protein [Clostridia bacterium]